MKITVLFTGHRLSELTGANPESRSMSSRRAPLANKKQKGVHNKWYSPLPSPPFKAGSIGCSGVALVRTSPAQRKSDEIHISYIFYMQQNTYVQNFQQSPEAPPCNSIAKSKQRQWGILRNTRYSIFYSSYFDIKHPNTRQYTEQLLSFLQLFQYANRGDLMLSD